MIFRTHILLLLITFTPVLPAYAQDAYDPKFYCDEQDRFLTDAEFLEIAFVYEVTKRDLPEPFLSLGIDGMREIDPGCCLVLREDNPFLENRSWLGWWLFDPYVFVMIGWDLDPNHGANNATQYDISICGEITGQRGEFRKRNYNN